MRGLLRRAFALAAAFAILAAAPASPARADSSTGFADISDDDDPVLVRAILLMQNYTPGIVSGVQDPDGRVRFHPGGEVKRGELLKMVMTAAQSFTADHSRDDIHWAGRYYTIAMEHDVLLSEYYTDTGATGLEGEGITLMFPCTAEALEEPVSRYETAAIVSNACTQIMLELEAQTGKAYRNITDYRSLPATFTHAVEQAVGKGLMETEKDGSFNGGRSLTRREAVLTAFRMLWDDDRTVPKWAKVADEALMLRSKRPIGFQSFAEWVQAGHMDRYYNIDAEAREKLFGSSKKYYLTSVREAEPYVTSVTLPVWGRDRSGSKYETTVTIKVNKMVAEEIKLIFAQIFEDEERFPMAGCVGGLRAGDRGRHGWGCAIDINATYNAECNFRSGEFTPTCGYGWHPIVDDPETFRWCGRPLSAYTGKLAPSEMSIKPEGSVVTAFADYGWGWGGSGTNVVGKAWGWGGGKSFDFMHFSIRPDGG